MELGVEKRNVLLSVSADQQQAARRFSVLPIKDASFRRVDSRLNSSSPRIGNSRVTTKLPSCHNIVSTAEIKGFNIVTPPVIEVETTILSTLEELPPAPIENNTPTTFCSFSNLHDLVKNYQKIYHPKN